MDGDSSHMQLSTLAIALLVSASAGAADRCPRDFYPFNARFEAEVEFQVSRTRLPLPYSFPDREDDELRTRQLQLARSDLEKYPRYPSRDDQARMRAERSFSSSGPKQCTVHFELPDSDMYSIDFKFQRHRSGWYLTEIEDYSL